MISLKEIVQSIEEEKKLDLVPVDDWTLVETDHLADMGFKQSGDHAMGLENPPMLVFRKKDGFHLKDGRKKKQIKFESFDQMVKYFDSYEQDLKRI